MKTALKPASFIAVRTLLLPVLTASIPVLAVAQQPSVILAAPDDSVRTTIKRSTHPLARPEYDVGAVDSGSTLDRLMLVLGPGQQDDAMPAAFLDSQQDKNSSNYHHWISPDEFGERFGPSTDDVQKVAKWLEQQGFQIETVARSRRWIEFSGTAQNVETAFRTKMRRYQVKGALHISNATDISVPSALAPVVQGILSLHDFFSKPLVAQHYDVRRNAQGALVPVESNPTFTTPSGTQHFVGPGDLAVIYDLNPLYESGLNGTGRNIAIVARAKIQLFDIEEFRQIFGLPLNDPIVIVNGAVPDLVGVDALEATLDAEWSGAVAPNATVTVVSTASTTTSDGVDLSAAYIVDHNLADVMSTSFQACEQDLGTAANAFHNALWQQAAAQGISVLVSAGDDGAAGCDPPLDPGNTSAQGGLAVNGLASTPFDTAVGGTQFNEGGNDATYWTSTNGPSLTSANGYIPEAVWNESCDPTVANSPCFGKQYSLLAGSGGVSTIYSKPSWQAGPGVPVDARRDLPDVSLAAAGGHDGYLVCFAGATPCQTDSQGGLTSASVVGGTSVSSPAFAGILAIAAQKMNSRQGLANYILYRLAASQQNPANCNSSSLTNPSVRTPCVFNDITAGNNSVPGQVGFSAQAGFDLANGLGSVDASNLVNSWGSATFQSSVTTLSAAQTSLQHGQPVQLTINVNAATGSSIPTGDVALFSDKFGPAGVVTLTNGAFSGPVSSLPGGQYNLTGHYQGDGTFGGSDSQSVAINITPEASAITLGTFTYTSSGPTPATSLPYGDFVYFHATVTGASGNGTPTGTVTFQEGTTPLGTFPVDSSGDSELVSGGFSTLGATICLPFGAHVITATYSGDNSFNSASSQPLTFTVTKANTFVNIPNITPLSLVPGQVLPLLVYVPNAGPILPTGTVQFLDNGTPLGSLVQIASAMPGQVPTATLQVSLPVGSHSITATYSGDAVYNPGSSTSSLPVTVGAGSGVPSQTALTAASGTVTLGQPINFTATVTASQQTPVPTGTIQINGPNGTPVGPVTLTNGTANIPVSPVVAAPLTLFAQYSGDGTYAASASAPITINVLKATPSINLAASAPAVAPGKPVSLQTRMSVQTPIISVPSDMVQYFDAVDGGTAQALGGPQFFTFGTSPGTEANAFSIVLPTGTNVITAQFLGDVNLNGVSSNPVTIVVGNSFQFSLSATSLSIPAGQSGSVILTVAPVGVFNAVTTLSCGSFIPVGTTCSIVPPSVTPNGAAATATLNLSTTGPSSSTTQAAMAGQHANRGLAGLLALTGLILIGSSRRRRRCAAMICAMSAGIFTMMLGCGGGGGSSTPPGPVGPAATTTTLTSSATKVALGGSVTLTATTTSSAAGVTGSITFLEAGSQIGPPVPLSGGVAQVQLNSLSVGTHTFTAQYGGDSGHVASTSPNLEQVITGTVQLQITASANGQSQTAPLSVTIQ